MADDPELLRRFAEEGAEAAFTEVVQRRVNLVYAAALRQTHGDSQLAEDVTQRVFLALAQNAAALACRSTVTSWLYTTTRFAAAKAVRARARRAAREQEAHRMNEILHARDRTPGWDELRPVIDEAMHELAEPDREAILLRYFEAQPLAQVGAALGLTENAARMRIDRALEKLRGRLAQRGIVSTAAALGGSLAAQPAISTPAGLVAAVASASVAGIATLGSEAAIASQAAGIFMSTTKMIVGVAGIAGALGLGIYLGTERAAPSASADDKALRREVAVLRVENERLNDEVAQLTAERAAAKPAAPAPAPAPAAMPIARPVVAATPPPARTTTEKWSAIRNNFRLIRAAADQFRLENNRSPASLDELVGETNYIRSLNAVDAESYQGLDWNNLNGAMTVTTASGLVVNMEAVGDPPASPPFAVAQEKAMAAFRAANGGRSPTGIELAAFFEGADFRQEFLLQAKALAFRQELGAALASEMTKAATAYKAANGKMPTAWADVLAVAPYFENPADRERLIEVWHRIDAQFGP